MTAFLVSFCNLGTTASRRCLAVIEPTGERWLLDLPQLNDWNIVGGAAGICPWGDGYMLALQGGERMLELNRHMDVAASRPMPGGSDMHGLCNLGDAVAVAAAGTDSVFAWRPSEPINPRPLYNAQTNADTLHINDLCVHDGRVVGSMFGPVSKQGVRSGSVFDVASGAPLIAGLREPHSVRSYGGALYVLESATGRLYRRAQDGALDVFAAFAGYVRGLALTDTHIAVGRSAFRPRSRSRTGFDRKPAFDSRAADPEHAISGLYVGDAAGSRFDFIDLSDIAGEIYDVQPIDMSFVRREALLAGGAEIKRRELVILVDQLRVSIRELQQELARRPPPHTR